MTSVAVTPGPGLSGDDEPAHPATLDRHGVAADACAFTLSADATRASIRLAGPLSGRAVSLLGECLDLHLAAGRRFVRVSLAAVEHVDPCGLELFARVHHALLGRRGTLILTGVGAQVQRMLADTGLDRELFVVGRFADDDVV